MILFFEFLSEKDTKSWQKSQETHKFKSLTKIVNTLDRFVTLFIFRFLSHFLLLISIFQFSIVPEFFFNSFQLALLVFIFLLGERE